MNITSIRCALKTQTKVTIKFLKKETIIVDSDFLICYSIKAPKMED